MAARGTFTVTLVFQDMSLEGFSVGDVDTLKSEIIGNVNSSGYGAMCSQWRDAFQQGATEVASLEVTNRPDWHVFDVTIRPILTATVSVQNGDPDRTVEDVAYQVKELFEGYTWDVDHDVFFGESTVQAEVLHRVDALEPEGYSVDV